MSIPNRTFVNPRSDAQRQVAFAVRERNKRLWPDWAWRVGLTFSNHIALDFDGGVNFRDVKKSANYLAVRYDLAPLAIFQTEKGFWIVSRKEIPTVMEFTDIYQKILVDFKNHDSFAGLDVAHAEISLKYGKTTLRISAKQAGAIPCKLVEIIE